MRAARRAARGGGCLMACAARSGDEARREGSGAHEDGIRWEAALAMLRGANVWQALAIHLLNDMRECALERHGYNFGGVISACKKASHWGLTTLLLEDARFAWQGKVDDRKGGAGTGLSASFVDDDEEVGDSGMDGPAGPIKVEVIKQAPGLIAVLKPPGVTSVDLLMRLQEYLAVQGQPSPITCISRLDIGTSGTLVAALGGDGSMAAHVSRTQFAGRMVSKEYLALCTGRPLGPVGYCGEAGARLHIESISGGAQSKAFASQERGKEARTRLEVLAHYEMEGSLPISLVRCRPVTGRTHQIRAHMAYIGRPLVSDPMYSACEGPGDRSFPRVFLHCRRLVMRDVNGSPFTATAPLPADLSEPLVWLKPIPFESTV
ncbi:unnamed protein product [Prorocentrum cordatum]|uniref:Pseudouridine synthase RsuA/RluA-like domain-containing protein n=1 Tax=Prorocentrum cordatum TaxID=2364126 RepID=A0ABN9V2Z0_9DINO|nr:unnamed protein product [Polarella glacialis]